MDSKYTSKFGFFWKGKLPNYIFKQNKELHVYIQKRENLGYKTHWREKQSVNPRVTSEQEW